MRNAACSLRSRKLAALAILSLLTVAVPLWACSVPVFRYALEKWPADPYEAIVFHRGPLEGDALAAVETLSPEGLAGEVSANVRVHTVDLDADPDAALIELWQQQGSPEKPHLVLRYPVTVHNPGIAWSGPLTVANAESVVDSPVRREIAGRLLKGETAVWILLEGADAAQNEATFKTLAAELKQLESTLKLPEISAEDIAQGLVSVDPTELRLKFSIVRLSREDPEEQPLVQMLLGSEPDLREYPEPMTFPVFGRGRALYGLVGAGINHEMVAQAGADLTGPCTCTVKEQNPGTDLLLAVDWDTLVAPAEGGQALPPLVAVSTSQDSTAPTKLAIPPGRQTSTDPPASTTKANPAASLQEPAEIEVAASAAATDSRPAAPAAAVAMDEPAASAESAASSSSSATVLAVAALGVLAVLLAIAFMRSQSS